jgi:hypothetical protein
MPFPNDSNNLPWGNGGRVVWWFFQPSTRRLKDDPTILGNEERPMFFISTANEPFRLYPSRAWLKSREGVFHAYFLLLPVIFFDKEEDI